MKKGDTTSKSGDVLWEIMWDEDDAGKLFGFHLVEWVVRSVRSGRIFATLKEPGVTWVKQSKKHFDWGWAKSIPRYCRESWRVGAESFRLRKTKLAAWQKAREDVIRWYDEGEHSIAALKTIDRMITQYKPKKKVKK